jgi:heme exporter protein CcmD
VNDFLSMDGYGRYLWPAYVLGFGIVILNVVLALISLRKAQRQARRRQEISS